MSVLEDFGNLSIDTTEPPFIQFGNGPDEYSDSENEDDYTFSIPELKDSDALEEEETEVTFEKKDVSDEEESSDDDEELIIDPEKTENVEIIQNPTSEPPQTFEETQQEEIIEDFEYEETPENIIVIEEALKPENKVIATDKQQRDDLLNQMIKNTQNIDSSIIKHQKKILRNFELLLIQLIACIEGAFCKTIACYTTGISCVLHQCCKPNICYRTDSMHQSKVL